MTSVDAPELPTNADQKSPFGGMTKEELMKYADDPFWVRLRWFLFITFWVLWAAMLVGAILIIYAAPKCDPPPPRTWWQVGPLAEIDADAGAEQMKSLNKNIKGVIITYKGDAYVPLNESHKVIKLLAQVKESGTKFIIDLDPTASKLWFKNSENNGIFSDYYIWEKTKQYTSSGLPTPPNNWAYLNNTSSWIYSAVRKQYYYAPLSKPHLNFRNETVVKQFAEVIKKFIDRGASGVRIRNAPLLLVDPKFADEKPSGEVGLSLGDPGFFKHTETQNVKGIGELILKWKEVVKNKTEDGLVMVSADLGREISSYEVNGTLAVDLPLLTNIFTKPNVTAIKEKLDLTFGPNHVKWPLWKEKSSHLPSDVINIVTNLLPGTTLVEFNETIDERLLNIRESPSIMRGNCENYAIGNNSVFAFVREISGNPGVLVMLNTGDKSVDINVKQDIKILANLEEVTIQHYSQNYNETDFTDISAKKDASRVPLSPKSVLVLQYVPKKSG